MLHCVTFKVYRKAFIGDLKVNIVVNQSAGVFVFFLHTQPIGQVEITGLLVSVDIKIKRIIVHLDDGTGIVRCTKVVDGISTFDTSSLTLGKLVTIRGSIEMSETNYEPYGLAICVQSFHEQGDTNLETFQMLRTLETLRNICTPTSFC
ncbi:hypothetical protein EON65_50930 [archaeon]|nr:MAG: hypothetical protein EON65_50930 [archaeon]